MTQPSFAFFSLSDNCFYNSHYNFFGIKLSVFYCRIVDACIYYKPFGFSGEMESFLSYRADVDRARS